MDNTLGFRFVSIFVVFLHLYQESLIIYGTFCISHFS